MGEFPFREAIAAFRAKTNIDTDNWYEVQGIEHQALFAVATAKGAVLSDLRQAVDRAIADGTTLQDFRKDFDRIVAMRGWSFGGYLTEGGMSGRRDWRSRLIWETNLRTSYSSGRRQQLETTKASRPYWQWRHGGSRDPRPLHLALDGKVFRASDPFWNAMMPAHGYGCKCTVFSLSDRDLKRLNLKVEDAPRIGDEYNGIPVVAEPGWGGGHQPTTPERRAELVGIVTRRMDPAIAARVRAEMEAFNSGARPRVNTARLAERRARIVEVIGEALAQQIEDNFAQALEEARVWIDQSPEAIEAIAREGTIKSLFEVSNGEAWKTEEYREQRRNGEGLLFGYDPSTPQEQRPVYGYLGRSPTSPEVGFKQDDYPDAYGEVTIELRAIVKQRTSFTFTDSLSVPSGYDPGEEIRRQPSAIGRPDIASIISLDDLSEASRIEQAAQTLRNVQGLEQIAAAAPSLMIQEGDYFDFLEAQIHGGANTSDIARIIYPPELSPSAFVRAWAIANDIVIVEA